MKQRLTLIWSQMCELITEHELNGKEEITFSGTISADDYIMPFIEWLNNRLFTVTFEPLDNDLENRKRIC